MGVNIRPRFNRNGKKLEPDEKARISIGIYWDSKKRKFLHTDYHVTQEQWDSKKLCVKPTHSNYKFINAKLNQLISKIETYEYGLISQGQQLTEDLLDDFARRNFENFANITFNEFFKRQMDNRKFNTVGTYKSHKKTFNKFNEFKKNVAFYEMTTTLVEQFDDFMKQQGLMLNTRSNHHKNIKANLHLAASEGYIEHIKIPYATQIGGNTGKFKIRRENGSIINLDFEERERIEKLDYSNKPTLNKYKKVFLFMCYTGLRISDMENLKLEHLHHSSKGFQIDLRSMIKTGKPIFLELFELFQGKPEIILKDFLKEKFGTDDFDELKKESANEAVFDYLTGQVLNRELKTIASDAKIYKNVTAHVGRHTFGTHMAILTNGDVTLIRDLLGHSNTDTTMIYIKLAEKMRSVQLKKVDWDSYKEPSDKKKPKKVQENPAPAEENSQPSVERGNANNTPNNSQLNQIKKYIYEKVMPSLDLPTKGEVLFSLVDEGIQQYIAQLPFSPEDYSKYQENPIPVQGYINDSAYLGEIEAIQDEFNKHAWVKGACLKLGIMFMPVLDEASAILI